VEITFEKFFSQNGCTGTVTLESTDLKPNGIKVSRSRFHIQHAYILFKGTERQSVKIIPSGSKGSRFEQGT